MKRADDAASTEDRTAPVVPLQQTAPAPESDDFVDTDVTTRPDPAAHGVAGPDVSGLDVSGLDVAEHGVAGLDVAAIEEPPELSQRGQDILAFEKRWWKHAGSKEQAIRDSFGLSATRYYQLLNTLLDDPLALAHDPVTVQRLRRLRATRTRSRGSAR